MNLPVTVPGPGTYQRPATGVQRSDWRTTIDGRFTREDRRAALVPGRIHPGGNPGGAGPAGGTGRGTAWRAASHAVGSGERQSRFVTRDGAAHRKGVRRQHGYAAPYAGVARQ